MSAGGRTESETHGAIEVSVGPDGHASARRLPAESAVRVALQRGQGGAAAARFDVAPTIDVSDFPRLLDVFCGAANLHLDVSFRATKLSSSHVVLEDTGLAMGMALFEMLRERMNDAGVNGAGASLRTPDDFHNAGVSAAVSV
ncbi:MAG: hypothetical protein ACFB00_13660 [Parvularculaceae bacterium]